MTPIQRLSARLVMFVELIGIIALLFSGEVDARVAVAPIALAMLCVFLIKLRFNEKFIFIYLAALLIASVGIFLRWQYAPIVIAAHATFFLHAVLWLAQNRKTFMFWRLGISFFEILITASLTPELHLFFLISAFVLAASLFISLRFLEFSFQQYAPQLARLPLKKSYIVTYFSFSILIFLSALILFPLIPRAQWSMLPGFGKNLAGYKEEVSMDGWGEGLDASSKKAVLRIFLPNEPFRSEQKIRLIRGRTLNRYDGSKWLPAFSPLAEHSSAGEKNAAIFRAIRESMNSSVVPVPYGASVLDLKNVRRGASGDWLDRSIYGRRFSYRFFFPSESPEVMKSDGPRQINYALPKSIDPRVIKLSQDLFAGARTTGDKLRKLSRYFSDFTASLDSITNLSGVDPVTNFLFFSKRGYCEAFAASSAVLLRANGVATRLVTGFRPMSSPVNDMLIVRESDAHVWVEVWDSKRGWMVFDPTPLLLKEETILDAIDVLLAQMSSLWYRYVLDYESDDIVDSMQSGGSLAEDMMLNIRALRWREGGVGFWGFIFATMALLLVMMISFWRRKKERAWYTQLQVERSKVEKQIGMHIFDTSSAWIDLQKRWGVQHTKKIQNWYDQYVQLRFGANQLESDSLIRLKQARKSLLEDLRKSGALENRNA